MTDRKSLGLAGLILVMFALPLIIRDNYPRHIMVMCLIYTFNAMGLNIIFGYTGQVAFGQPVFFGMGAYISSLLAIRLGFSFWSALTGTMIISAAFGFLIGYPCLQLRGIYFGIVTMSFAQIIYYIASNWISLTRGPMGLLGIPGPYLHLGNMVNIEFNNELKYYYLILVVLLLVTFMLNRLMETRLGRAFVAIRENEDLSSSVGIHPFRIKMIAFMLACMITAMGGSFYAHFIKFVSPIEFHWYYIGLTFIMTITGGLGTIPGPFVGAAIFTVLPEVFRALETYRNIMMGGLLMLVVIFFPEGIIGVISRWREKTKVQTEAEDRHA